MAKWKPIEGLSVKLRIFLLLEAWIAFFALLSGGYEFHCYSSLAADVDPAEVLLGSELITAIVGIFGLIVGITVFLVFLFWVNRMIRNLRMLSGQAMTFTPGWAVGWFFIPVANLFRPFQVMREIWRVSHGSVATKGTLVGWWWALWLVRLTVSRIATRVFLKAESVSAYSVSTIIHMVVNVVEIALCVVAYVMVSRIGDAYAQNIREPGTSRPGGETEVPAIVQP